MSSYFFLSFYVTFELSKTIFPCVSSLYTKACCSNLVTCRNLAERASLHRVFTHLESRLRSYPPHPGSQEHWSPPVQRSTSPFHQNSSAHLHLVLYARGELLRCQIKKIIPSLYICVKLTLLFVLCDLNPLQPSLPWHTCCS